jgi:hypothetical protein
MSSSMKPITVFKHQQIEYLTTFLHISFVFVLQIQHFHGQLISFVLRQASVSLGQSISSISFWAQGQVKMFRRRRYFIYSLSRTQTFNLR